MYGRNKTINFSTVMKLRTSDLVSLGPTAVVNVSTRDITTEDEIAVDSVPIQLSVSPIGNDLRVQGKLSAPVRKTCDRCLIQFEEDIETDFEVLVVSYQSPLVETTETEVLELSPGQLEVDLVPYIRDAIVVGQSMKNLCREDCKGLCPQCGKNLNQEDCSCSEKTTDERWSPLKEINFSTVEH